uniref:Uncharacterized protein n=1 Tax=Kalanchoe fedtschenkoi TaxID=63787 RepID=A0A7N1A559_KALFE
MDWKPVAKRTRSCQKLYFRELHERIKLERSSGGGGSYGGYESPIDSRDSVVGGLKQGRVGVESGSKVNADCMRKGVPETISDDDDDDVVLFGGGDKVGGGRLDDDVVLLSGGGSESEERSGGKGGVDVDPDSVEDSGDEVVDGGGKNMEASSSGMGSGVVKVEEEDEAVMLTSDGDEEEEEGNEAVLDSEEEEEVVVHDVDSDQLSDSDYKEDESNEEADYEDDVGCFAERPQKKRKTDCSNEAQESGECVDLGGDVGTNGWVSYHSGKVIYWNGDKGTNDIVADHTQVESGSDLMSQATVGEDESMNDIDIFKPIQVPFEVKED